MFWLFILSIINGITAKSTDMEILEEIQKRYRVIEGILQRTNESEYKVYKLLELLEAPKFQ